jgi:hypothetical protein
LGGDGMADAVAEIAAVSIRYGARQYAVHRSRDDAYRILQLVWFESKTDWERYWDGPEMVDFRARNSGRFQIPVLYVWHDEFASDRVAVGEPAEAPAAAVAGQPAP